MNTPANVSDKLTSKKSTPEKSFNEEWKPVKGFEGKYEISNLGKLRSLDRYVNGKAGSKRFQYGKTQNPQVTRKGYLRYTLSIKKGKSVRKLAHVLLAEHFILNPENKPQVNHKDGIKSNNHIDNLEWSTCQENISHAWKNGLNKPNYANKGRTGRLASSSKPIKAFDKKGNSVGEFESIKEASEKLNIPKVVISRYLNGHVKNPRKYTYQQAEIQGFPLPEKL